MHAAIIVKILGILLMIFSLLGNVPPLLISLLYDDGASGAFLTALLVLFITGLGLWLATASKQKELSNRDGFLVVTLFWAVLGTAGCLPFIFSSSVELSITDAVFESISGLTTTGDCYCRSGCTARVDSVLPAAAAMAWGHGNHCLGGCAAAHAGYRWYAALPGREPGPS